MRISARALLLLACAALTGPPARAADPPPAKGFKMKRPIREVLALLKAAGQEPVVLTGQNK